MAVHGGCLRIKIQHPDQAGIAISVLCAWFDISVK